METGERGGEGIDGKIDEGIGQGIADGNYKERIGVKCEEEKDVARVMERFSVFCYVFALLGSN